MQHNKQHALRKNKLATSLTLYKSFQHQLSFFFLDLLVNFVCFSFFFFFLYAFFNVGLSLFHLSGKENFAIPPRLITACELFSQADFYTTHLKLARCRNSTVTLFSQNNNTLFSLLLSDVGGNILYQTKDRKKTVKKALLECHSGRWSTTLNLMSLSSALQRKSYVAYPDCNKGIRPFVNGYISPRVATSGKRQDTHMVWSRDGCLDNTLKAPIQPNHFGFDK